MKCLSRAAVLACLLGGASLASAMHLQIPYQPGLNVDGNLEIAPGRGFGDTIVLIVHGTLSSHQQELMRDLQQGMKAKGLSSLAITLSLGISGRRDLYPCERPHKHLHTDAIDEIHHWIDWLQLQGARDIVVFGHSRGGNQVARYVLERLQPIVRAQILLAPSVWTPQSAAQEYRRRFHAELERPLHQALGLVAAGRGDEMMIPVGFLYCTQAAVTANAFLSYYREDARLDTTSLVARTPIPALVIAGSEDTVSFGVTEKLAPLVDGTRLQTHTISGADHFFRDLYADDVVDRVLSFLGWE